MAYIDDVEIPQDDDGGITMPRTIEDDPPIDDDNIDVPVPASPKEQEDSAGMHDTSNTQPLETGEEKSAPSDAGDANVNSPLYIRTFGEEGEDLGFHYIAHVSLDVIEEKLRGAGISSSKDDMYLGFLGPVEDYRVYGYVTNTSVKFVVVLQDAPVRESELRPFFAEVHRLYVNAMSNPFAPIGERLTSQTFDKRVSNLVVQHNTGA
ncbi:hypothetical protein BBJ29_001753 [Phytophthora kernoviae]|uniref:Trafficking protein particle complex subunit 2-like protein n=1 Tax=Phytophthora kernoviae TaxID=325452 RepID=A0A3F2S4U6_9STRA|nr:hypothetical protein BBJ29_001753 [Phytophthora kernoviae]RLN69500.1 hypothetical protein BBP00_00000302 [Phytophthora kernoviae]